MHTLSEQLRGFCHPACEAMSESARLTHLVRLGVEAADRICEIEVENTDLREQLKVAQAVIKNMADRIEAPPF